VSVRIHRQNQKIEKRVLLRCQKLRGLIIHVAKIAVFAVN
jgi:hypothetical protein